MVSNSLVVNHEIQDFAIKSDSRLLHTQCRVDIQIVLCYQIYLYVQKYHSFPTSEA